MPYSIVQVAAADGSAAGTTIAATFASPVTAGNTIVVFCCAEGASTLSSCADTVNGSYGSIRTNVNDTTNNECVGVFLFSNSAGGTPTVTVTLSGSEVFRGILAVEVAGALTSSSSYGGSGGQAQNAAGTDGVTTGNVTPSGQPAGLLAISMSTGSAPPGTAPNLGTGFSNIGAGTFWTMGSAGAYIRAEHKRLTSTGAVPATFTQTAAVLHAQVAIVVLEAPTVGPTPTAFSPTDNATGASRTPTLTITFDENVQAVSGNITIKKSSDNSTVETISVTNGAKVSFASNVVTITPNALAYGTEYYVLVDNGAIESAVDAEDWAGVSSTTAWSFTTALAVDFAAAGAAAFSGSGGTSVAPAWPASGDNSGAYYDLLVIGIKPLTSGAGTATTPSGWTSLGSLTGAGGYGAQGGDTGNCDLFVFGRISDGTATGTLSVTIATGAAGGIGWGKILRLKKNSPGAWNVVLATGSDVTGTSNIGVTFGSDPGVAANDLVVVGMCIPTDVNVGAFFSSNALTQTGVTFGTIVEQQEFGSSTGNDIGGIVCYAPVTAGSSSAAPSYSATAATNTNSRGPAAFVRLRSAASNTLTAGNGSYAVTGNATGLRATRKLVAAAGTFALTGNAAGLTKTSGAATIVASSGAYALTGNATGLRAGRRLVAAAGTLALTGNAVGLRGTRRIVAQAGSYGVTGNAQVVEYVRTIASADGTYVLAGNAVGLRAVRRLTCATGSLSLTGNAATLALSRRVTAQAGTYALGGQAVALSLFRRVVAAAGSYAATGSSVGLRAGRRLPAASGTYGLTGSATALSTQGQHPIIASPGAYSVIGNAVGLRVTRRLVAQAGSYAITGAGAALNRGVPLPAGAYALTGFPAALRVSRRLQAAAGTYGFTALPQVLRVARRLPAQAGTYGLAGNDAQLGAQLGAQGLHTLAAASGTFTLTGRDVGLRAQRRLAASSGAFGVTGSPAAFVRGRGLMLAGGSFALTGNPATFSVGRRLLCDAGTYALAGRLVTLTGPGPQFTGPDTASDFRVARPDAAVGGFRAVLSDRATFRNGR